MFDLKVDEKFPHHYLIGVAMKDMHSKTPGKMYLKTGPVYFTNDDVERLQSVVELKNDKIYTDIYKVSDKELVQMYDCGELISTISGFKMACMANHASIHHFSCEVEIYDADGFFESMVDRANTDEKEKERLMGAIHRY